MYRGLQETVGLVWWRGRVSFFTHARSVCFWLVSAAEHWQLHVAHFRPPYVGCFSVLDEISCSNICTSNLSLFGFIPEIRLPRCRYTQIPNCVSVDVCLLCCNAGWTCTLIPPTFRISILPPSSMQSSRWRQRSSRKRWYLRMSPHGLHRRENLLPRTDCGVF